MHTEYEEKMIFNYGVNTGESGGYQMSDVYGFEEFYTVISERETISVQEALRRSGTTTLEELEASPYFAWKRSAVDEAFGPRSSYLILPAKDFNKLDVFNIDGEDSVVNIPDDSVGITKRGTVLYANIFGREVYTLTHVSNDPIYTMEKFSKSCDKYKFLIFLLNKNCSKIMNKAYHDAEKHFANTIVKYIEQDSVLNNEQFKLCVNNYFQDHGRNGTKQLRLASYLTSLEQYSNPFSMIGAERLMNSVYHEMDCGNYQDGLSTNVVSKIFTICFENPFSQQKVRTLIKKNILDSFLSDKYYIRVRSLLEYINAKLGFEFVTALQLEHYIKDKKRSLKEKIANEKAKVTLGKELKTISEEKRQKLVKGIIDVCNFTKTYNLDLDSGFDALAVGMQVSRAAIDAISKEEGALESELLDKSTLKDLS